MPLQTSHIKYALDVKNNFSIDSLGAYLSGTVYPDSRWMTGEPRKLTHDIAIIMERNPDDDFRKGWLVHSIFDEKFIAKAQTILRNFLKISNRETTNLNGG